MTSGILLVDKPGGMTSHDVVSRVRRLAGTRKVGHAGTLDPMATGLLVLGVDSSTRLLTFLVGLDKEYYATIRLGFGTTTDDAEGEQLAPTVDASAITRDQLARAIEPLTGHIQQVPSAVSAIKVDGRRAYDRVRSGESVELKARSVTVSAFEILDVHKQGELVDVDVRVECTSGTYIRALARDLGAALHVGAHLTALRRTRIGPFRIQDAGGLDEELMSSQLAPASVAGRLFSTLLLERDEVVALAQGKKIRPAAAPGDSSVPLAALAPDGRLAGLVTIVDGVARIVVNFPTDEVLA